MSDDTVVVLPAPGPAVEVNGLHSPPDSNSKDASDSELSDLEVEDEQPPSAVVDDDIGEIEPAYYSNDGVPVFVPTMDQFRDFTKFMNKVNKYGMRSGIVKVIPPAEWKAAQPRLDDIIKTVKVKEPIKQDIMGTGGTYRQANILHQRSYNLPQWRNLCDQSEHQPPAKRGERRANQDKPIKSTPKPKGLSTPSSSASKKKSHKKGKSRAGTVDQEDEGQNTPDRLPTPFSPIKADDDTQSIKMEGEDDEESFSKPKLGSRQAKAISISSRRKNNRRETGKIDEAAFKDFQYELESEDYTPERCEELERAYWKTLTYAPPLYGADMPGTLFDERTTSWNLGKLDNILDVLGAKIPGVNTAYLYLGMWKATFAWHLEDVDLYSINYLHFGAPKQWYSIAQGDARRFEAAMKTIWPTDAKACDQFLRHKTFLISPSHLLQNFNIKVNKIVHNSGEFVITFPYGYHSGYNLGYNCAEVVNFGLESWLEYGRVAKKCDCAQAQDSVWIDVHDLERKMRGEETEYEETDEEEEEEEEVPTTDLPTPPESSGDTKPQTAPKKKRKRPVNEKGETINTKKIRIRIKAPTKEPCVLCPNDIPSEPLLPTEEGQKAHKICAQYIPETSIDEEIVTDVKFIDKARLDLKCNYCRSRKGACFQCSQKKCTRAYHATCAAAAGVSVQQGEIPVFGVDGTEYKEWGIEFSCRFHRPKRDKKLDSDSLDDCERLRKGGKELKIGEVCQAQYYKGDIFAGAVVENRTSEETVLVDILPRGGRVEIEYKWLLIPDPADYHLPKPSAKAIPMPKSRKDKESLNTSKRQVDDIPRAEDPFVTGHTWAEFKNENIPRNPFQAKIDFNKENQVWFYLGKTSTEAKAQFTEDLANPRHNPKGHFLDTIPKPAPVRQSYAASYPTSTSHAPISKALNRPSLPASTSRPEKPYVYKPRNTGDMYRVDPQAYSSQQKFLQQSTPYSFGTDPRYRSTNPLPTPYSNQQNPVSRFTPQSSSPLVVPSAPSAPNSPSAPYRPSYAAPVAKPKPSNPFNGRTPPSSGESIYTKYPYLQKEHNRSPLEYKSPYRPGGGFMNGYQGSLEKHLQQTLFQSRPGTSLPNPLHAGSQRTYSQGQTVSNSSPAPTFTSTYSNFSGVSTASNQQAFPQPAADSRRDSWETRSPAQPSAGSPTSQNSWVQRESIPPASNSPVPQSSWEKREPVQLHPAIRQQYQPTPDDQYNPSYRPPPQPQNSVLQPPPQYTSRIPYPAPYHYPQFHPTPPQSTQPYNPQQSAQQYNTPQPTYQYNSPSQPQAHQTTPLPPNTKPSPPLSAIPQQASLPPANQQYYQTQHQLQGQENKPVYAHQQYFQKPQVPEQVSQPLTQAAQKFEPADVPADSTSIVEKMMRDLKKATGNVSTA